jgi:hypothetical protein
LLDKPTPQALHKAASNAPHPTSLSIAATSLLKKAPRDSGSNRSNALPKSRLLVRWRCHSGQGRPDYPQNRENFRGLFVSAAWHISG